MKRPQSLPVLCHDINTATLPQLAANDGMSPRTWRKRHEHLTETELRLIPTVVLPCAPAYEHHPGDAPGDFEALSYHLMTRFDLPVHQEVFVSANSRARKLYGGKCKGLPRKSEAFHNALLAALFFSLDERTKLRLWVSEAQLKRTMRRCPDAAIRGGATHRHRRPLLRKAPEVRI